MMAYLSVRGCASGPLFMLQDGRPLSRVLLTDWLRQIISAAGKVLVAMDTSLLYLRLSGSRPTFKAPVLKLIYW